jgi:hypothetical protein
MISQYFIGALRLLLPGMNLPALRNLSAPFSGLNDPLTRVQYNMIAATPELDADVSRSGQ